MDLSDTAYDERVIIPCLGGKNTTKKTENNGDEPTLSDKQNTNEDTPNKHNNQETVEIIVPTKTKININPPLISLITTEKGRKRYIIHIEQKQHNNT